MAITNGYCTLAELKAACRISDSQTDTLLEKVIEAASRRIDGFCGRFFYQVTNTSIKFFPSTMYSCALPDLASDAITVSTDDTGAGTFSTVWSATDYQLEPFDAVLQSRPYTRISSTGSRTFPLVTYPNLPTVQVTGTWGWSAVPDDVREACVLLSMRMYSRYSSPLGVAGFSEMGAVTVRSIDPDVRDLLSPYVIIGLA